MKKFLFALSFAFTYTVALANSPTGNDQSGSQSVDCKIITINNVDHCYSRSCWADGKRTVCTEWQEVPCDKGYSIETAPCQEEEVASLKK